RRDGADRDLSAAVGRAAALCRACLFPEDRQEARLWAPRNQSAGGPAAAASGADLLSQLVEPIGAGPGDRLSGLSDAARDRRAEFRPPPRSGRSETLRGFSTRSVIGSP